MQISKAHYIFRLDDIHPEMNWANFERIKNIFDRYGVRPIIAVIPHNCDQSLKKNPVHPEFWILIKNLEQKGWTIAMHGYDHGYTSANGGIINTNNYGEFSGLSYADQQAKIKKGKEIFLAHNLPTKNFIAPAHSFDRVTCKVLREEGFEVISDGVSLFPFRRYGLLWIPQIAWRPCEFFTGMITFCFHSDTCIEKDFAYLENFLKKNNAQVISFDDAVKIANRGNPWFAGLADTGIFVVFYLRKFLYRIYKKLISKS